MEILQKKLERQIQGTHRWANSKMFGAPGNGMGTLWYYTAVGKTYTALLICEKMFLKHGATVRIIVTVPSEELVRQWKDRIKDTIEDEFISCIEVYTIHYLVEHNAKANCDLLIVDEIHEFLTEERLKFLNKTNIQYKYILGLTATWKDNLGRERYLKDICPVVDVITEKEALDKGFISKYIEYNLSTELTPEEYTAYKAYSRIISKNLPKFGGSLLVAQKCLQGGKHEDGRVYTGFQFCAGWAIKNGWTKGGSPDNPEWSQIDAIWNPSKILGYAKELMNAIRERKDILYNASDKATKAVEVIKKFPTLKTICFAQSTHFADKIGYLINEWQTDSCVVYHSQLATTIREVKGKPRKVGKTILRREAISKIKSGEALRISTASALDKGFDVEDIRLGITTSGTQNPTQHSQRGGRVKRLEIYNPDATVLIVNIYVADTKDEDWLRHRQKDSYNTVYWVKSVEEIGYTPINNNLIPKTLI